MALNAESIMKDDIKTRFKTREGTYKLIPISEFSRLNKIGFSGQINTPVRVSFLNSPDSSENEDTICFNYGRELCIYRYKEIYKGIEPSKPVDKRVYKGTNPTSHDFNRYLMTSESILLIVGFSGGQVQLIDILRKEFSKLYNEDRQIDSSKVTCLKWLPSSANQFLVAHSSGHMYIYNADLLCTLPLPHYQLCKQGDGFAIYCSKNKPTKNPLYKWSVGNGCINEFAFSPCSIYLAVVSQDGFLRVFNFSAMDIIGIARSYFGGFLCVSWSPDSKFLVMGGEDDLVTIWRLADKNIVARGQGHKSWISVVMFDPYISVFHSEKEVNIFNDFSTHNYVNSFECDKPSSNLYHLEKHPIYDSENTICNYRIGSVGQDTYLCLWDLNDDILKQQPHCKFRTSVHIIGQHLENSRPTLIMNCKFHSNVNMQGVTIDEDNIKTSNLISSNYQKFNISLLDGKENPLKKSFFSYKNLEKNPIIKNFTKLQEINSSEIPLKYIGTSICPRLEECPILEPLVCKKIAHERLTSLLFCSSCIITACQDGTINAWSRPECCDSEKAADD